MLTRPLRALVAAVALALPMAALSGVVSRYTVNGETVSEGITQEEFLQIAGEPRERVILRESGREQEWLYYCRRAGAGPCTVVQDGGQGEMRARFRDGRLKGLSFGRP